jgi:ribonuclease H2 subunit C
MLAINSQSSSRKLIPNLVPCSVKHSGPITIEQRHWNPQETHRPVPVDDQNVGDAAKETASAQTAYLRGRKLQGKKVRLPSGYRGYVLEKTTEMLQPEATSADPRESRDEQGEERELQGDVHIMGMKAQFEEVMVWAHEVVPEDDDPYVRGIQDWITLADAVSSRAWTTLLESRADHT